MRSLAVFLTVCLAFVAAGVKRQAAVPPSPTSPPMQSNVTDSATTNSPMQTSMMADNTTTDAPAPVTTETVTTGDVTTDMMPDTTTPDMMTTTTAQVPETTTKKLTIEDLVSIDEIVQTFKDAARSEYLKKLPLEQQLIVLEILSGGETGKMTPVLEQMETKKLLSFMYNLPFKYVDTIWRLINLGYTREELIAASNQ